MYIEIITLLIIVGGGMVCFFCGYAIRAILHRSMEYRPKHLYKEENNE